MKIAVVGAGSMGGAILKGFSNLDEFDLIALNPANPRVEKLAHELKFQYVQQTTQLVELMPDVVILTTPAPITIDVAEQLSDLNEHTLVISAAAGVTQAELNAVLPKQTVATMIPNTPVAINAGTIGLALPASITETDKKAILHLLNQLGDVILVPENQLAIVGVVGGCGPAFVDVFMDAMSDAAVKHGLSRQTAYELIASMVKGSGALAYDSKLAPAILRDQVASPGGTTIRGLAAMEENNFRNGVIKAIDAASEGE